MSYRNQEEASEAYARRLQQEFDRFESSPAIVDHDFQLALKLQESENSGPSSSGWGGRGGVSDEEFARQLQAEVDAASKPAMSDEEFARMLQNQLEENENGSNNKTGGFSKSMYPGIAPPLSPPMDKGKAPMMGPVQTSIAMPIAQPPLSPPISIPEPQIPPPPPSYNIPGGFPSSSSPRSSDENIPAPPPLMRPPTPPPGWVEPPSTFDPNLNDPAIDDSINLARQLHVFLGDPVGSNPMGKPLVI